MKRIYFFIVSLLVGFIGFSQATHVQIETINSDVYTNVQLGNTYGTQTSDAGLNTIFQNHQINYCYNGNPHPVTGRMLVFAICSPTTNIPNFLLELNNYNTLITKTSICPQENTFGDVIYTRILNETTGIPIGFDPNGIVITNDNNLNTIFQNFLVKYFSRTYPSYTGGGTIARTYHTVCNCDVTLLKSALDAYNPVIEQNDYVPVAFLGINEFSLSSINIYPNPFNSKINIEPKESIVNYSIIDITGKVFANYNSKTEFDNQITKLNSGVYFLKLQFENGKIGTYKIIKE